MSKNLILSIFQIQIAPSRKKWLGLCKRAGISAALYDKAMAADKVAVKEKTGFLMACGPLCPPPHPLAQSVLPSLSTAFPLLGRLAGPKAAEQLAGPSESVRGQIAVSALRAAISLSMGKRLLGKVKSRRAASQSKGKSGHKLVLLSLLTKILFGLAPDLAIIHGLLLQQIVPANPCTAFHWPIVGRPINGAIHPSPIRKHAPNPAFRRHTFTVPPAPPPFPLPLC